MFGLDYHRRSEQSWRFGDFWIGALGVADFEISRNGERALGWPPRRSPCNEAVVPLPVACLACRLHERNGIALQACHSKLLEGFLPEQCLVAHDVPLTLESSHAGLRWLTIRTYV